MNKALWGIAHQVEAQIAELKGRVDSYTGDKRETRYIYLVRNLQAAERMYEEAKHG